VVPAPARTTLRILSAVAPPLAVRLGARAFSTVGPPARVRSIDAAVHAQAVRGTVQVGHDPVATYTWEPPGPVRATVLLVHGWRTRASRFGTLVGHLRAAGVRVVAYDAPGHGDSGGHHLTVVEHMAAMHAVTGRHGPVDAVVGHSLGAFTAGIALHEGFPARHLVALASPTGFDSVVTTFRRLAGVPDRLHEPLCAHLARTLFPGQDDVRDRFDLRAHPAGVPAVFVHDTEDTVHGPGEAVDLHAAHPGSRLVLTRGLGHNRVLDDAAVARAVVEHVTGGHA
jgi:pimeloyl-ACP methyl ester carboxylesterase